MATTKKLISQYKFDRLEKKYGRLCQEHKRLVSVVKKFEYLSPAVFNFRDEPVLMIKKVGRGVIYLSTFRIKKGCCDVCCKKRKTTGHHIIPVRIKSENRELAKVRIRVCEECNEKIHPENGYDQNEIIRKQNKINARLQIKLNRRAENIINPFAESIDSRIEEIKKNIPRVIYDLKKEDPRKIHPSLKRIEGRLIELKWLKNKFKDLVNKSIKY